MSEKKEKMNPPHYEPKGTNPKLSELYNDTRYTELLAKIESSNITDDEKAFLRCAATRFIEFNFPKIGEFYCNADADVQEGLEKLKMVVIDEDNLIRDTYKKISAKITNVLNKQMEESQV